jgi:glyoxylase-like metal-dependent hydrolase (beta-lactamase superfamily II)
MDRLDIPEEQIVPLETIAPGVTGLRLAFVNVFALSHADGSWTLIDAGLPFTASIIRRWAEHHFSRPPNAIVLTHGHFDHVSAARDLAEAWDVFIYAHPLEFPYLNGEREYPAPNPGVGGGLMSLLSPMYPRGPANLSGRLFPLKIGGQAGIPRWQVVHTPGHTPGHISFFRPQDHVLIAGDALCTTKPESFFEAAILQHPELHGPPAYFTLDWYEARTSIQFLADLHPAILAPGHGKPIAGANLGQELQQLAKSFDHFTIPESQRKSVA